jgi:spore coat protein U-like protein
MFILIQISIKIWGNGTGSTVSVSDSYTVGLVAVTRNYAVYGRLLPLQNVSAGLYSDTLTVTVDY